LVHGQVPSRAALSGLTLLLVVALTVQLAPMVVQAGQASRVHEQVRVAEPLRLVMGVPARRQGEKNDKVSLFARRDVVPVRLWDVKPGGVCSVDATAAMHLGLEMLVSLPPPVK
jgi:hypothetical protein